MRSVNKVTLIGNLTRDPESKDAGEQSIVTFGLATNREWIDRSGEKKSLPEFHNIVAFGKLGDICANYLKKGKLVYVEGYLKTRNWDSPEGVRIYKTEIVALDMIMLDKKKDSDNSGEDYYPDSDETDFDN